jgi:hypothetical protein
MFRAYTESGETIRNQMAASETTKNTKFILHSKRFHVGKFNVEFANDLGFYGISFGVPTMFIPSAMFTIKSLVTDRFNNNMF